MLALCGTVTYWLLVLTKFKALLLPKFELSVTEPPLQKVVAPLAVIVGAVGLGFELTFTVIGTRGLTFAPCSQLTLYVLAKVSGGVTKGEPTNKGGGRGSPEIIIYEASHQVGDEPATQVADKEAVLLVQIVDGPVIFVGTEIKEF